MKITGRRARADRRAPRTGRAAGRRRRHPRAGACRAARSPRDAGEPRRGGEGTLPASVVFRRAAGTDWAVFTIAEGRARLRPVVPGHRTAAEVEILKGVAAGEHVILHPQNELRDGARVATR
ncbi:MAG: hypothetical protein ACYC9Y_13170 [Candidatus Methylomirabilia bacterium]